MNTISLQTSAHIRQSLRQRLGGCSAMAEDRVVERIGAPRGWVLRELNVLIQSGEVEALRPISPDRRGTLGNDSQDTHYRLCRETDRDFIRQQRVVVQVPSQLLHMQRIEAANESRSVNFRFGRSINRNGQKT